MLRLSLSGFEPRLRLRLEVSKYNFSQKVWVFFGHK
jgi:hypothetical protein